MKDRSKRTTVVIESDGETFQVQTIRTAWDSFRKLDEALAAARAALVNRKKRDRQGKQCRTLQEKSA